MNALKYVLAIMILVLTPVSWAVADNFDSRELLFDTMITGLDAKDLTDQEKQEITTKVDNWVGGLSEEQVFAFNESLNNARHTPWKVDFTDPENWDLLDLALDNNYNNDQIIALTKALESEAKFLSHYERTGKEFFLDKAERSKIKFLSKVDRFDNSMIKSDIRNETRALTRDLARQARREARAEVRQTSRSEAKAVAKNSVREARNEIKTNLRGGGQGRGKKKIK